MLKNIFRSNEVWRRIEGYPYVFYCFLIICISFVLCYWLYSPIFSAPFMFDDAPVFRGLGEVGDISSAIEYITSGYSGALGRPLSHASFLLNNDDWPDNPAGFRRISMVLHLFNAFLVFVFSLKLTSLIPSLKLNPAFYACCVTVLWCFNPIHFTAILMPVQRMAVLSGSFVLFGLVVYVKGLCLTVCGNWKAGLLYRFLGVFGVGFIGVFAKENAALLPFFAAVLDFLLSKSIKLNEPKIITRVWRYLIVAAPSLGVVLYYIVNKQSFDQGYHYRSFELSERLATETLILWEYVRGILIADFRKITPFGDGHAIYSFWSPQVIFAVVAWVVAVVCSMYASFAKNERYYLAALIWFFSGHILESTIFPLELYFEHRNYVASLAPIFLVVGLIISIHKARWILAGIVFVAMFSLWRLGEAWSEEKVAAKVQYEYNSSSIRAVQFYVMQLDKVDRRNAFVVLNEAANRMPMSSSLVSSRLFLACSFQKKVVEYSYAKFYENATRLDFSYSVLDELYSILERIETSRCEGLDMYIFRELLQEIVKNDKFRRNHKMMHHFYHMLARTYASSEVEIQLYQLLRAYDYLKNTETFLMIVELKNEVLGTKEAFKFFNAEIRKNKEMFSSGGILDQRIQSLKESICPKSKQSCETL